MAKKTKKTKKIGKKIGRNTDNSNKIRYLQTLIKYSLRAAESKVSPLIDDLFLYQAARLENEIEKLKENQ